MRKGLIWSRTGTWGNGMLATQAKGRVFVMAQVQGMVAEIAELRQRAIPSASR